jgi:murein DD-endopeptidase MepM/ murein hydrolase activator NlpD
MSISGEHAGNMLASFLSLMVAGCTVSSCAATGLRTVTPSNAPPDISSRWGTDSPAHRGISIGGRSFLGREIIAAADGVVVFAIYNDSRVSHIRIHHGLDSNKQDIYTDHYHVLGQLLKEGDKVKRGQTLGHLGRGKSGNLPHYHFIVTQEESPRKFSALDPGNYWFGIDQYKEKLAKGLDVEPFAISCFDPSVNYPKEPVRFTYPVKCK